MYGKVLPGHGFPRYIDDFDVAMQIPKTIGDIKALRVSQQSDGNIHAGVQHIAAADIGAGEVFIRVSHSSVNYKDALASTGQGRIVRQFPLTTGIDLAGEVVASDTPGFSVGDQVLAGGYELGTAHDGGYAEYACVPADWIVPMPESLTPYQAMLLGTAGFTVALCLHRLQQNGQSPDRGAIVVTGASGGVGSIAVNVLSRLGYEVVAVSSKSDAADWLTDLGARHILHPQQLDADDVPLQKGQWGGGIDNVGGKLLHGLLSSVRPWGNVVAVGLAADSELHTTVLPFILRGVSLLGVTSANCPRELRLQLWQKLAGEWCPDFSCLQTKTVGLTELPEVFAANAGRKDTRSYCGGNRLIRYITMTKAAQTLYDKLWQQHRVRRNADGSELIYIDRHLLHEVTSPQAFAGLRQAGREIWRKDSNLAVEEHNVPTLGGRARITDTNTLQSLEALEDNCSHFGIIHFPMEDIRQGIVHVMGPEQGASLPGMSIVCGDSHTSTNGALGALAFGIGTSEIEHVLATQCLPLHKAKNMRVTVTGDLLAGVHAKDIILRIIGEVGTAGGTGHAMEFAGATIENLSMEGRMTVCNMSIEAGSRYGIIAVDDKTIDYVRGRPFAPVAESWEQAIAAWQQLHSDEDAVFDCEYGIDAATIAPQVTWGTSPEMVLAIDAELPDPEQEKDTEKQGSMRNAYHYMGLVPGMSVTDITLDKIFLGSCTNSRIEDLRVAAAIVQGKRVASSVQQALVVPGSGLVKRQAEKEGLAKIFVDAGFEWRDPGCSMCLAMNADRLQPGERCASTSNRNFEGRQGQGGRTHLASPAMVAAAAVSGHFVDVRDWVAG